MHFRWMVTISVFSLSHAANVTKYGDSSVHPIEIDGKHFIDSVTGERFLIRGVDYQPGGSASYTKLSDPLSDVDVCARDIYLFQQLGVNTVRVYTVNPRLNHDACMTMFAAANIYLLLDVNSPLVGESINRYEPWTTYTPDYLRHVFEVVDQFSRYNNTLGFFIGNEIINDERSASVSPPYIKAVARDVKDYMFYNCIRSVPLGYSAADDLRYRKQLSHYLTCGARETSVDFYGVNSYQWCGAQTIRSSGYDVLIKDHADFPVPLFFSEFGCNLVKPRMFQEVAAIYSPAMTDTFSGGLVYEFTQEENDYGLVDIDTSGNAFLRGDFETLRGKFSDALVSDGPSTGRAGEGTIEQRSNNTSLGARFTSEKRANENRPARRSLSSKNQLRSCLSSYPYLSGARHDIPESFGTDMIRNGVRIQRGKYLPSILDDVPVSKFDITSVDGSVTSNARITVVNDFRDHIGNVPNNIRGGVNGASKEQNDSLDEQINDETRSSNKKTSKKDKSRAFSVHGNAAEVVAAACVLALMLVL